MPSSPATPQPSHLAASASLATFLQPANAVAMAVPATLPPALGTTVGTSVMPHQDRWCSIQQPGTQTECSTTSANVRCTAQNGHLTFCSAADFIGGAATGSCSAFASGSVCSTLPPSDPAAANALCSANNAGSEPDLVCSAIGTGNNIRCSTKGEGSGFCSAAHTWASPDYLCSVINAGATQRSFCSTKFNQPGFAKGCSTVFDAGNQCSVVAGGKGVCTTFGAADPVSCSANGPGSHCSVIGGPAGNFCTQ